MAITLGDAVVMLRGDDSPLKETLDGAEKATKKAAEGINKAALAIGAAALAGVGLLAKGLWDAGQAAAEEEVGIAKLAAAVDASGASWNAVSTEVEAYIAAAQKRTAFDDGVQRQSLTNLIATTGDYQQAMALLPLAMDIARAKGMDLATASDLVGKVAMGNTSILTRYGIVLQEGATAQEALAELQARFAGQAEAYGNTVAGKTELMKQQWGNLMETIGGFVLPILLQLFTALGNLAESAIPMVSQAVAFLRENADIIIPVLAAMAATLTAILIPSLVALAATASAAAGTTIAAMLPILGPIAAVGAAVALLAVAWKNDWGGIQEKTQAVIDFIRPYVEAGIAAIRQTIQSILGAIKSFWATWGDDIMSIVQTMIDLVKNLIETALGVIKGLFQTALAILKGDWKGAWEAMRDTVKTLLDGIKTHIETMLNMVKTLIGDFSLVEAGQALIEGMIQGIRNMAGALVNAASGVINDAIQAARNLLGWHSPSTVFMEAGRSIGEGMILGIRAKEKQIYDTVSGIMRNVTDAIVEFDKTFTIKLPTISEYDAKFKTKLPDPDPFVPVWPENIVGKPVVVPTTPTTVRTGGGGGGGGGGGLGGKIIVDDFGDAARAVLATLATAPAMATTDDLMRQMEFEARLRGGAR